MNEGLSVPPSRPDDSRFFIALGAILFLWTALIGGVVAFEIANAESKAVRHARSDALSSFKKDILFRKWASEQGGVYVPVTDKLRPNPYLDVPNRDVRTTDGVALTLVNPAYMTRLVHELGSELNDVRGRITSLKPINPINESDDWERAALISLEDGAPEVLSVRSEAGEKRFRFMRPFITEESCLKCHGAQGYRVGDVRGGISVSLPFEPFLAEAKSDAGRFLAMVGAIWLIGVFLIVAASRRIKAGLDARAQTEELLRDMNARLSRSVEDLRAGQAADRTPELSLIERVAETQDRLIETEKTSALGLLVAGIAHELNTPLGAIASSASSIDTIARRILRDWGEGDLLMTAGERGAVVSLIRDCADSIGRRGPDKDDDSGSILARFLQSHGLELSVEAFRELSSFPLDFDLDPYLSIFSSHRAERLILAATNIAGLVRCNGLISLSVRKAAEDIDALALYSSERVERDVALCDAASLLEAALGRFEEEYFSGIAVERDFRPARPVLCNRDATTRVIYNLIKNALQAISYRGTLFLSLREQGGNVQFDVANEGPAIPPAMRKRLFTPFFTTKKKGEAAGLGLFLTKQIVERSGGTVSFARSAGKNVFSIRLPVKGAPAFDVAREGSIG